jgi:hypothetical protein
MADACVTDWNAAYAVVGSFADEHSMLQWFVDIQGSNSTCSGIGAA